MAIFAGITFWIIVGPNLALSGVVSSQGHNAEGGPRPLVETLQPEVTAAYWLGTATSMAGFFVFFGSTLAAFKGEKTWIFWIGLIILGLTSVILFSILWYALAIGGYWPNYWRTLVRTGRRRCCLHFHRIIHDEIWNKKTRTRKNKTSKPVKNRIIEKIWNKNCDFVNKERGEEGRLTF